MPKEWINVVDKYLAKHVIGANGRLVAMLIAAPHVGMCRLVAKLAEVRTITIVHAQRSAMKALRPGGLPERKPIRG